ncbi:hypothetical protein HELRODRAFT_147387, partial [Helobdella robusta]|uniref:CUB domain-containing protein n=1 Tax=Helobdella robusta TaxID=6412 RepID=T1EJZ7_HELRO
GVITSPNYPNNYPNKLDCKFSIEAPDGATITITFQEFSIEAESDCSFDRLEFIDPLSDNTKLYCGSTLPPPVISKGNKVSFLFSTDSNVNNGNFKITY